MKFMYFRTMQKKICDKSSYQINTRSKTVPKLSIFEFKNNTAKKAIIYFGSIFWHELPHDLKRITAQKKFCQKIKTLFRNKIKNYWKKKLFLLLQLNITNHHLHFATASNLLNHIQLASNLYFHLLPCMNVLCECVYGYKIYT